MKCGFFDCNNPTEKGKNSCQNCDKRAEWNICSACRQPEPEKNQTLTHHDTFLLNKFLYQFTAKMRDKAPSQFRTEIDQVLPDLKLSEAEGKLIDRAEKIVLDFLAEKGGQQDNDHWFQFCSVCLPELDSRIENFANQHPEAKSLKKRIEEAQEKLQAISQKIGQAIGKDKWDEIGEKAMEELEEEIGDSWRKNNQPTGPGNQNQNGGNSPPPNSNQNNDNSVKITQLQQEINSLKQEIRNLKNTPNSTPPNPNTLQEKESQLRKKEKELEKLNDKSNNPPSNKQQSSKDGSSNLPLYLGLGVVGVVVVLFTILLVVVAKKKKKRT